MTTTILYDAAHKYGLDSMSVTPALGAYNMSILGSEASTSTSWTGDLNVNQPATISALYTGGFKQVLNFVYTSTTAGVVTLMNTYRTDTNELLASVVGSVSFTLATFSMALQYENIYAGSDVLNGNAYNNSFKGYAGNDRIDGSTGIDTAYFSGFKSRYTISISGSAMSVVGPDGTDTLLNIERLQFDDKALAVDINGNAGQVYRLYQAAFDRKPDMGGLGVWINQMDNGQSLEWVSAQFQTSQEFKIKYGSSVSTDQFVTLLYQNVLHRLPDSGGLSAWKGALDAGAQSRAQVLAGFSESTENQIALIGSIQNGIEYIPA
jgi:hypothetical protein